MGTEFSFVDLFLHLDKHLDTLIQTYGTWTYVILFLIIFCETGLVVTPFLPGDSLLFAAGALASRGSLDVTTLMMLLVVAAVIGNMINYAIGYFFGSRALSAKLIKKEYLERTQHFYEKYGAKTIIISRFLPIIRTIAPFLAGVGKMPYPKFTSYNLVGGVLWVVLLTMAGYCFSEMPFVKNNFSMVVIAIIVISLLPAVFEAIKMRRASKAQQ